MPTQDGDTQKSSGADPQANAVLIALLGAIVSGLFNLPGLSQGKPKVGWVALACLTIAFLTSMLYLAHLRRVRKLGWKLALPFVIVTITAGVLSLLTWLGIGSSLLTTSSASPRILSGLVYIDLDKSTPRYERRLAEALLERKWQVTTDPARSAVILSVQVETKTSPGLAVGGTATWQADGEATLRVTANNSDRAPFASVGRGHAVAMQSDHAADDAAIEALERAADDFTAAARKEGS